MLSKNIMQNYDRFVSGISDVDAMEQDLLAAHATTAVSRNYLAGAR